jgi:hypothetical protein
MQKKYLKILLSGFFILPVIGLQPRQVVDPGLILATPTPTATPSILLKPNLNKNLILPAFKYMNKRGVLKNVKVTAKDGSGITVDNSGTEIKVTVQADTHYRRRYWGKSSLAEISVGDMVDIVGKWQNEEKTEIKAVVIRNLSVQKRHGVFFGTVKTITDTGFVMTTIQKGEETVTIDATTKLINRKQQPIKTGDILVGHRVRIRGLWDSTKFTITEVTEIKDFNIPVVASPKPTEIPEEN